MAEVVSVQIETLRAEVERLNTAWKAIDRANESLREQLGTAEADVETARTAARYLADALLHGGDGRHYMQALAFWPWIQTVVANESAKGNEVKCRGCGKDTGLPGVEVLGLGHMHLMCEIARLNDALTLSKQIIAMAEADRDKHRQRLAAAEAEIKRLQTTPYNSGDDDGRNHFEIEAAKGGRDGAE